MENSYDRYAELLEKKGLNSAYVSKQTGIPQSTFSDWKKGKSSPKLEKLAKIANCLETPLEYLAYGTLPEHKSLSGKVYYFDDETAKLAQKLHDNPILNTYMSSTMKLKPDQIEAIQAMITAFLRKDGLLDDDY